MIEGLVKKYKNNLIGLLHNYVSKNRAHLTVSTEASSEEATVTVHVKRTLFDNDVKWEELLANLARFGEVNHE